MALTREQLLAYAAEQIRTAERPLADHEPADAVSCLCGRNLPCPQARSLAAAHDQVASLDRTQQLPVVAPPGGQPRLNRGRSGVLSQLARLCRRSPAMEIFETARLDRYFCAVTHAVAPARPDARALVITHLLADRPPFIRAVDRVAAVAAVMPKPKSVHRGAARTVEMAYPVDELSRDRFADPDAAVAYLEKRSAGAPLVLLDVGGYFAPVLGELCDRFSGRILGVVEDTENGHRRYLDLDKAPCPVYSVARSPLKQPEDHLVGQSIVFSTEALMRSRGDILPGRAATVIGFGKLGSSIARTLHAKGVRVTVYDADPVRATQALAQGFHVAPNLAAALATAGMVMCATGNLALRGEDFASLPNGAYLASVTSSEDELELDTLTGIYDQTPVAEHVTRYATVGHYFYVLAGGNAVNFLHGASVGAFIFLVHAEILAAAARCASGNVEPGYHEVPEADRRRIAEIWLAHFNHPGAHR